MFGTLFRKFLAWYVKVICKLLHSRSRRKYHQSSWIDFSELLIQSNLWSRLLLRNSQQGLTNISHSRKIKYNCPCSIQLAELSMRWVLLEHLYVFSSETISLPENFLSNSKIERSCQCNYLPFRLMKMFWTSKDFFFRYFFSIFQANCWAGFVSD